MVWKEVLQHNYAMLSDTVQSSATKVVEVAQKAEATAKAVTIDAAAKAESAAKAAVNVASNPQEVVATGLQKVEAFGNKKLAEIDAVRLKTKEMGGEEDESIPSSIETNPSARIRTEIWMMFDNPTSSLKAHFSLHLDLFSFNLI
jgi:hypothetical protein